MAPRSRATQEQQPVAAPSAVLTLDELELDAAPSGYSVTDDYFATMIEQGGRVIYTVDLSIPQLVSTVPKPDPAAPIEGNRRIDGVRARAFAHYVKTRPRWVCPPIILRAPSGEFLWTPKVLHGAGTQFGTLSVPRLSRTMLAILDGQHRCLGFHLLWEEVNDEIIKAKSRAARSRNEGDNEIANAHAARVRELTKNRDRLSEERVQVQIMVTDDPRDFKQVFFDIADHAKGISGAVKVRFDTTKTTNRALDTVLGHPLLVGRVEQESDRITGPYLLGAKHVADIIRALQVGATGRITKRLEDELDDKRVINDALDFFSLLCTAFPELAAVRDRLLTPKDLRSTSLLGSSTFLRVLAGTTHNLVDSGVDPVDVIEFFSLLRNVLNVPITHESPLLMTGCFQPGTSAPSARMGDIAKLEAELTSWARTTPSFLISKPQE